MRIRRNRLPLLKRDELDADGKALYDFAAAGSMLAGVRGPSGLRLYSPKLGLLKRQILMYFRTQTTLDPQLAELAILIAAREGNQHFEWHAHEPAARKAGLSPATIDAVRLRLPVTGLEAREAALIRLGREAIRDHAVSSETFASALLFFGTKDLLEYVTLMGDYLAAGVLLTVFDQQLPPGQRSTLPL